MYKARHRHSLGFTIVELLVVIVVIGVLAAVTFVSYSGISRQAITATLQSDLNNGANKLKLYYTEHGNYPTSMALDGNGNFCPTPPDAQYCLQPSRDNVYGYSSSSSATFSLTATNGSIIYRIKNDSPPSVFTPPEAFVFNGAYLGTYQEFTVPDDVFAITAEVWGAQGGGSSGGKGGYVKGTLSVSPGEILRIYVGGQGATGTCAGNSCMAGGYNGGGYGGGSDISSTGYGGGGATDIRRSPYGLNDRLIVAGGGGSKGGIYSSYAVGAGGDGGQTGQSGTNCANCFGEPAGTAGGGATQSAGGTAGSGGWYSEGMYDGGAGGVGSLGQGGNGCMCWNSGSGGGGGGYFGGGGGGCPGMHGGGGGSSWVSPSATGVTYTTGARSGNGYVTITN